MAIFDPLTYPIMQAPIGSACSVELASTVTNAGGMGSVALTWHSPDQARECVQQLKALCNGLFAVNYVCAFEIASLEAALDAGAPVITLSWGMPSDKIAVVKNANVLLGIQVGSVEGARQAVDLGADFLICQGIEAGGHVQSSTPLSSLIRDVVAFDNGIPIVAAGGIATATDVADVINAGATIASLGTRFVNAYESNAHPLYQQAIVDAEDEDAVFTACFDGDWPYASVRVLRNSTITQWEACGCPPVGQRPGEGERVATTASGWEVPRYHIASPVKTTYGEVLDLALYAGTSSAKIQDVLSAEEIVHQLTAGLNHQPKQITKAI
ncbi:MAG: nitronate monooxygenase [Limisphaerales bacterium]